jgi:hypothetical protein
MSKRCFGSAMAIVAGVALVFLAPIAAVGQVPSAAAKAWDPPRTPDGQPDIQGGWRYNRPHGVWTANDLETGNDHGESDTRGQPEVSPGTVSAVIDPADGRIPYQPWAAAKRQEIQSQFLRPLSLRGLRPATLCLNSVPRLYYHMEFQVVQTRGSVVMIWEWSHAYRVISLDERPRVAPNVKLSMGDARGHWEGNTLVVNTANLNDWDWFDLNGATIHSDAISLVERFIFVDANTMNYQVTVTDPMVFTRPWTMAIPLKLDPDHAPAAGYELMEHACVEGERGVGVLLGKDSREQR